MFSNHSFRFTPDKPRLLGILCLLHVGVFGCTDSKHSTAQVQQTQLDEHTSVLNWVDPFIGTAGDHGQLHPAATLPFGMIQMGPETPGRPHSGYDFLSSTLEGFAHTRTAGVGCRGAGGNILVRADYGSPARDESGALIPVNIHKDTEKASAGYYHVKYGSPSIAADLTASASSGWQRYRFEHEGDVTVTIDALHAHHENYSGHVTQSEEGRFTGTVSGPTVCKEGTYQFHFSLFPDTTPDAVTHWTQRVFNSTTG